MRVNPSYPPMPDRCLCEFVHRYAREHDVARATTVWQLAAVRKFATWVGHPATLGHLASDLNGFVIELSRGNRETADSYRRALTILLNDAVRLGLVAKPEPIRKVRLPDLLPRALRHSELRRLCQATKRSRYGMYQLAAIHLCYDTALRRADVLSVRWSQVDERGVLRLVAKKTGRRIVRRIRPTTLLLCRQLRSKDDDRLIPFPAGATGWRKQFRALCRLAGVSVPKAGLQMIRRSSASYAKRAGLDPSELLGHSPKSGELAERYYIDPSISDTPPQLPPRIPHTRRP